MLYKPTFGAALLLFAVVLWAACADGHAEEVPSGTLDGAADEDTLRDLRMTAARNRTMLHHTRFILKLAEADTTTRWDSGDPDQLSTIAADQVRLAETLSAYTGAVCGQRRFAVRVRNAACALRARNSAAFMTPAELNLAALSSRTAAIDDLVGIWWDKVCSFAPPAATPTQAACVLE